MYLDYWGFEKYPFDNVPDPDFLYLSEFHEEALTRLVYAAEMRKGCALLAGEIGCGKTTLSRALVQKVAGSRFEVLTISNPCLGPKQFLQSVLYQLNGKEIPDTKVEIVRALGDNLDQNLKRRKKTLLIIDETQLMSDVTLEEVRLLLNFQSSNSFLITVILLGQPEFVNRIRKIKQFEQRVAIKYFLRKFKLKETAAYILFRQKKAGAGENVFSREAINLVYKHSEGSPRSINNVCDLALLVGFGEKKKLINSSIIKDVLNDGTVC